MATYKHRLSLRRYRKVRRKLREHRDGVAARGFRKRRRSAAEETLEDPRQRGLEYQAICRYRGLVHTVRPTKLADPAHVNGLLHLAALEPIRAPSEWRPKGKGRWTLFRSLVDHLLVAYPMPKFLYSAFGLAALSPRLRAFTRFFADVARGCSGYHSASNHLAAPLTRRMVHGYLRLPARFDAIGGLRWVRIRAHATDLAWARRLHAELKRTVLGCTLLPDEGFWADVIDWLARNPLPDPRLVGAAVRFVREQRVVEPGWSIKGRTPASLVAAVRDWQSFGGDSERRFDESELPESGFAPARWEVRVRDRVVVVYFTELRSARALYEEGRAMHNCVFDYLPEVSQGDSSIWSLREVELRKPTAADPPRRLKRRLTVEVDLDDGEVCQARGPYNQDPSPEDLAWVEQWATGNGLTLMDGLELA